MFLDFLESQLKSNNILLAESEKEAYIKINVVIYLYAFDWEVD